MSIVYYRVNNLYMVTLHLPNEYIALANACPFNALFFSIAPPPLKMASEGSPKDSMRDAWTVRI